MTKSLALLFLWPFALLAAEPDTNLLARVAEIKALVSKLHYQQGTIPLKGDLATLSLPDGFRYLSPEDTDTVLVKMWGNPPGGKTLGMIIPPGSGVLSSNSWAVVITYLDDGYVKDADANKIDYSKLLKDMQNSTRESNPERERQGYESIELIGWATPPSYDGATHKMYWAQELQFGHSQPNTLNYDIRVLGRSGVLVLNAVAPMKLLPEVQRQTPDIVKMVDFNSGHRYADFNGSTDKVAAYGLAALVAGGIAAKLGFFKLLWIGLLAAKKFVIIGVVAASAYIKKLFRRKQPPATPTPTV